MTVEDFSNHLAALLIVLFPNADDRARAEMGAVSQEISRWLEELIDARIANMRLSAGAPKAPRLSVKTPIAPGPQFAKQMAINPDMMTCDERGNLLPDSYFYWPDAK